MDTIYVSRTPELPTPLSKVWAKKIFLKFLSFLKKNGADQPGNSRSKIFIGIAFDWITNSFINHCVNKIIELWNVNDIATNEHTN